MLKAIVVTIYFLPIAIEIFKVGDKPVNLVPSDIALVGVPLLACIGLRFSQQVLLTGIVLGYFPLLAMMGAMHSGDIGRLYSGLSFSTPFIHVYAGYWMWKNYRGEIFPCAAIALASILWIILFSDVLINGLPRGCGYEGRWGGCMGPLEVFGFPNSSMSFLVLLSPVLLWRALAAKNALEAVFFWASFATLLVMTPLSLSRSSLVALVWIILFLSFWMRPLLTTTIVIASGVAWSVVWHFASESFIFSGIVERFIYASELGDVSTGRVGIWKHALNLVLSSPLFGYSFEYFTRYSEYGTVHQQYLEVLYKSGFIGFIVYSAVTLIAWIIFVRWSREKALPNSGLIMACAGAFFSAALINGIFQPILSYSPMGNVVFLLVGVTLAMRRECEGRKGTHFVQRRVASP